MLRVTIMVDAPGWQAQGIKESLAMELERFGDCRVVRVEELERAEQMVLEPEPVRVRRAWALPQSAAPTAPSEREPE